METNDTTTNISSDAHSPDKYIRTLEGDMETLKKGGTPDLSLLKKPVEATEKEPVPAVEEKSVEMPVPQPVPEEVPIQQPVPVEQKPVPVPEPAPEERPAPLETYSSDFLDRMKETHSSTATVLAAEQDAAAFSPRPEQSQEEQISKKNIFYSIAGIVLLVAGATGAYVAYGRYVSRLAPVALAPTPSAPIFVDEREQVSGVGIALMQEVQQMAVRPLADGAVRLLYFEISTTSPSSVFHALQLPAPDILLRNIIDDSGMTGIVRAGEEQNLFFILSAASYGDTFAGMLAWESTILRDLDKLFPPHPVSEVASSTSLSVAKFIDDTIDNHDVRVYRDEEGRSVILYGYWNRTTLVIARDEASFSEILRRLATSRTQ